LRRREFLAVPFLPAAARPAPANTQFDRYFLPVLAGYLRNCAATSPSLAVCDYPDGTTTPGALAASGKTYDSVSRMMPALAAWVAGGREPGTFPVGGERLSLTEVLRRSFVHAFDPDHPDYWMAAGKPWDQRQVESSIVAWSLWLLGDSFIETLTPGQRVNIQNWLASCTQHPCRRNNWAWFTAVNQAARLSLGRRWREFSGDEQWMIEDLTALDGMAAGGDDGWYSDSIEEPTFDYYNFWVFASHFLYWNRIVGDAYPKFSRTFGRRLRRFLRKAPNFFGANGSHVLFGRSLIYRWGVLTPLVLSHQQDLWPHSPGLLRHIVRKNLEHLWGLGAFDEERGSLRETLAPGANRDVSEPYIDQGHPYWGMQAFSLFLIPERDGFWSAREEPLPVERSSFRIAFEAPRMLLAGERASGQVRWLHTTSSQHEPAYRDKYTKFSYSSHFPFNVIQDPARVPWDCALVFRNPSTGECAGRAGVHSGDLVDDLGARIRWWAELGEWTFEVTTEIRLDGEFEQRRHRVRSPQEAVEAGIEGVEGSYALGLGENELFEGEQVPNGQYIHALESGFAIFSRSYTGHEHAELTEYFGESGRTNVNIVSPRMVVNTLRAPLTAAEMTLSSVHYASPKPLPKTQIMLQAPGRIAG